MTKQKLLETAGQMPDNFEIDELIERLIVIEKIDKALESVAAGQVVSNDEALRRIDALRKKAR